MKVYCILGDERALRSKSPALFSAILKRLGIRGSYVPFMVAPENLGQALQSLRVLNIAGANVTVPYKETCLPCLDALSEGAEIIGAINTIVCKDGQLKGYNTNAIGIMDALSTAGFKVEGTSALVIGTGGAAKAAVFILNWLRTQVVYVCGRSPAKTLEMAKRFHSEALSFETLSEAPFPVDILVNATAVSTPDESPKMAAWVQQLKLPHCRLVLDLNYGRQKNFWQEMAEAQRIRFMDGLGVLAAQARRTFALWTGIQVPPEEFVSVLKEI